MADGNNYRENRWFKPWRKESLEEFVLPEIIQKVAGQLNTKIGNAVIQCLDAEIASEICEEVWIL